jgi:hypothetical protein
METRRLAKLELLLILAAPGLMALCVLWWLALGALYTRVGATGLFHYLLPAAALVGGFAIFANQRLAAMWRLIFGLTYLAIFLWGALAILVATGLELV